MRFYAACLASYNSGVLHGRWIDATDDVEEMQEEIAAMLRESRFPNVTVLCPECEGTAENDRTVTCDTCHNAGRIPSAEEWAIHDYEGMPSTFGEFCGLQIIAGYVELVASLEDVAGDDASEDLAAAMVENWHDVGQAKEALDGFITVCGSFRDYSDEVADDSLQGAPELARKYFDYEAFAHDLKLDYTVIELNNGLEAIFHD